MSESPLETLRRMPVFGGLSANTLTMILDQSQLCQTAAAEYFFHEHDEANSFYVIQYGRDSIRQCNSGTC